MQGDEEVRYFGGDGKLPLGKPHHHCVHSRVSGRVRGGEDGNWKIPNDEAGTR